MKGGEKSTTQGRFMQNLTAHKSPHTEDKTKGARTGLLVGKAYKCCLQEKCHKCILLGCAHTKNKLNEYVRITENAGELKVNMVFVLHKTNTNSECMHKQGMNIIFV